MDISEIAKLLQDMRNNIIKESVTIRGTEVEGTFTARKLFDMLSGQEDASKTLTDGQCINFYKSLLYYYIVDDTDSLEELLAVSGLLEEYQSKSWTAANRRREYVESLSRKLVDECERRRGNEKECDGCRDTKDQKCHIEPDALIKREERLLKTIARSLKKDFDSGKMPELLKEWVSADSVPPEVETSKKSFISLCWPYLLLAFMICGIFFPSKGNQPFTLNFLNSPKTITQVYISDYPESQTAPDRIGAEGPPVEEIKLGVLEIALAPGGRFQLHPDILPAEASGSKLSYDSSNPSIVSVSDAGWVIAREYARAETLCITETVTVSPFEENPNNVYAEVPVTVRFSDDAGALDLKGDQEGA